MDTDKAFLRFGAVSFGVGLVLVLVAEMLHPGKVPASDSPRAFVEYGASSWWAGIHLLEFVAVLVLMFGFVCLFNYLRRVGGSTTVMAWGGLMAAVVTVAVFAILQAIDGYTLKYVIGRWLSSPPEAKEAAYRVAEGVRWLEIGVNAYFRTMLGVVLMIFGLATYFSKLFPRWLSSLPILAGLGSIWVGLNIGMHGFSASAGIMGLAPFILYASWLIAMAVLMWKRSESSRDHGNESKDLVSGE